MSRMIALVLAATIASVAFTENPKPPPKQIKVRVIKIRDWIDGGMEARFQVKSRSRQTYWIDRKTEEHDSAVALVLESINHKNFIVLHLDLNNPQLVVRTSKEFDQPIK